MASDSDSSSAEKDWHGSKQVYLSQLIGVSAETKEEFQQLVDLFICFLQHPEEGLNALQYVKNLELALRHLQANSLKHGPLSGLIFDLNFYNVWVMFRNQKVRFNAKVHNRHPCGYMSHHLIKYAIERVVYTTDRLFLMAPCSGIQLPQPLACSLFEILKDVRGKCTTAWRRLGAGRRHLMTFGRNVLDEFNAQKKSPGGVSRDVEAFLKICFPQMDLNKILIPIYQHAINIPPDCVPSCTIGDGNRKRAPHGSLYSKDISSQKFCIPDPLFASPTEPGLGELHRGNMAHLLQNPEEIINMDPLHNTTEACLYQMFSETITNPSKKRWLSSFNMVFTGLQPKSRTESTYEPLGPFSPISPGPSSAPEEFQFEFSPSPQTSPETSDQSYIPTPNSAMGRSFGYTDAVQPQQIPVNHTCGTKRVRDCNEAENYYSDGSPNKKPTPHTSGHEEAYGFLAELLSSHRETPIQHIAQLGSTSSAPDVEPPGEHSVEKQDEACCNMFPEQIAQDTCTGSSEDAFIDDAIKEIFASLDSMANQDTVDSDVCSTLEPQSPAPPPSVPPITTLSLYDIYASILSPLDLNSLDS
ncbi:protein Rta [Wood mouse herpesvirus]|uniref:Protein Rta n=1 Tax=Wood mouse herpesvirus TaxID=432370 RepID=D0U1N9_9GAMA|nr:protein Rta [Wood mouse herpesvirus]ACY41121.1 protein Rta [Wood mouse herpesvirus]